MTGTYGDVYGDVYGDTDPGSGSGFPQVFVLAGFGGTLAAPAADALVLGGTVGLGTAKLGAITWTDITGDVRSVSWNRGRDSDIDTASPGSCTIVLDNFSGDYDPANLSGPYVAGGVSLVELGTPVTVRAEWGGTIYDRFAGDLTDISMDLGYEPTVTLTCGDGLETLGRAYVPLMSAGDWDGDRTGTRIGRIADSAGWPTSLRALDVGYTILGPTLYGGSGLQLMHDVEQTEFGLLFVDGAGVLTFYDRYRPSSAIRSTSVQAAFTDQASGNDVEMVALEMSRSRERVFNEAHITRDGWGEGDEPVEQVAEDSVSVARYGRLSFPEALGKLLRSDEEALAAAQGIVARFAYPQLRIRQVTIDATTLGLWSTLLPLRLLDRISVSRDYGPNTVTAQLLIEGMQETISARPNPEWTISLSTANVLPPPTLWVLGTAALGTTPLGW